ncbi:hypothetical protein J4229_00695 [Candidatus Pacearchaeota archaeon]|nr:hypothetical protein [Candidatus Pacearchaeota archaeon]
MQDVIKTKERIISIIDEKGPSFPVQIARAINVSPLFTSVFLSELHEDNKLKTTNMKIGSSSLYFLQGQEQMLENFIEHLNQREKEAFYLIKKSQVLEDEKQSPIIRVALREIKDFAHPFKIKTAESEKIFWKYHLLPDSDFDKKVQKILNPLVEIEEAKKETIPQEAQAKPKAKKQELSDFAEKVKDYLLSKEMEVISTILEKKKEFVAKIRADILFGKQEFYLIAKEKKKINETDLALALQKAQSEKMPALIISPGEIDKKALPYLKEWRNLIKFEKLNI